MEKATLVSPYSVRRIAIKHGYRSGFEHKLSDYLKEQKCKFDYESIKIQHPKLDIRFVFENSRRKLRKGAKSTYAEWCIKYGFKFHDRIIPEEWIKETGRNKHPKFIVFPNKKLRR